MLAPGETGESSNPVAKLGLWGYYFKAWCPVFQHWHGSFISQFSLLHFEALLYERGWQCRTEILIFQNKVLIGGETMAAVEKIYLESPPIKKSQVFFVLKLLLIPLSPTCGPSSELCHTGLLPDYIHIYILFCVWSCCVALWLARLLCKHYLNLNMGRTFPNSNITSASNHCIVVTVCTELHTKAAAFVYGKLLICKCSYISKVGPGQYLNKWF